MSKKPAPRLGRGLAALLGEQGETFSPPLHHAGGDAARRGGQPVLGVDLLEPSPFQPRLDMDETRLDELTASIESQGLLQPILVRPHPEHEGRYQIIAGERRWRAAQRAGLHEVPVHVRQLEDAEALAAALVENLQRADLNAIEEAEGLRRLLSEYALTQEELATLVAKSRPHISNMLRLLALPEPVRKMVREGRLSAGHARAILAHPDPVATAERVVDRKLTVRQTEALLKNTSKKTGSEGAMAKASDLLHVERALSSRLGVKVTIDFNGRSGSLRLAYQSLDQFDAIVALLSATS